MPTINYLNKLKIINWNSYYLLCDAIDHSLTILIRDQTTKTSEND